MDDLTNQIETIIFEEVKLLNRKIKGINLLELIKYNLLEKIKPLITNLNFEKINKFTKEFKINTEERLILAKLIFLDKPSSILKKTMNRDTLIISLKEVLKIDIFKSENTKEFVSFLLLPKMGVCLSSKTNINFNFSKDSLYLEIEIEDKIQEVEN